MPSRLPSTIPSLVWTTELSQEYGEEFAELRLHRDDAGVFSIEMVAPGPYPVGHDDVGGIDCLNDLSSKIGRMLSSGSPAYCKANVSCEFGDMIFTVGRIPSGYIVNIAAMNVVGKPISYMFRLTPYEMRSLLETITA